METKASLFLFRKPMTATDETLSNEVLIPLNETGTVKKQLADMLNSSINPDHSKPFSKWANVPA